MSNFSIEHILKDPAPTDSSAESTPNMSLPFLHQHPHPFPRIIPPSIFGGVLKFRPYLLGQPIIPVFGQNLSTATFPPPAVAPNDSVHHRSRSVNPAKTAPVKKYKCDVCSKTFSRSNTLVTHKRIHTGEKPFKCEHCGRAFRQPGNLTRHRLTHTTVKPYICSHCGKAFNRASNLHTHIRTHSSYRPFVCPFCAKGFHQKVDMKVHCYSHTGERPYKCDQCQKGFTLASTLTAHRRTHSTVKPFTCPHCSKQFYQRNSLKSHLLASHPFIEDPNLAEQSA